MEMGPNNTFLIHIHSQRLKHWDVYVVINVFEPSKDLGNTQPIHRVLVVNVMINALSELLADWPRALPMPLPFPPPLPLPFPLPLWARPMQAIEDDIFLLSNFWIQTMDL
jgi:hypothetical protein